MTLANAISGSGNLEQFGDGVTSINAANTYTGGTTILAGTLAIGKTGALGAGTVSLSGGELLATANETLTQRSLVVWNFDHRRRAWDHAQRRRVDLDHRGAVQR